MSIITLPDWLRPQTMVAPTIQRAVLTSTGRYSQATDVADLMTGDTWAMSIGLASSRLADSGRVEALVNRLVGGVNQLQAHHFGRPVPMGTARGSITLSSAAAVGDSTLTITGATVAGNLLRGPNFEVDSNSDGLANFWQAYAIGSSGSATYTVGTPFAWGNAQVVVSTSLGAAASDRVGVSQAGIPVSAYVNSTVTSSAYITRLSGEFKANLALVFFDGLGAQIGVHVLGAVTPPVYPASNRYSVAGTVPAGSATAQFFVWAEQGPAGAIAMGVDAAKLELGLLGDVTNVPPQWLEGDMIGVGGKLFQVALPTALNDVGDGVVSLVNRVRAPIASGSAVTWNKPAINWRLLGAPRPLLNPGYADGLVLDLIEHTL